MHFILAPGCIDQFAKLRSDYEHERGSLDKPQSFFGKPTSLGGINIPERRKQIIFLEQIKLLLQNYLIPDEEIKTAEQWKANLMASRIMITACLYVQSEIGRSKENSTLYTLINRYLGIDSKNFLDEKDREECIHTAFKLSHQPKFLEEIKSMLAKKGIKEFAEDKWSKFSTFIDESNKNIDAKSQYNKYPITSLIQPVFIAAFSYVGSTVGWVAAEAISSSSMAVAPRLQLTAAVGSTLLFLGPTSITGIAFLAPTIASRLLSTFCTLGLSSASGKAMGLVGQGVGTLVALPFDLAYNLLRAIGSLMVNYATPIYELAKIDGVLIADGTLVIQGIPIEFKWMSAGELEAQTYIQRLEIKENYLLLLNGKEVDTSAEVKESLRKIHEASCAQIEVIEPEIEKVKQDVAPAKSSESTEEAASERSLGL